LKAAQRVNRLIKSTNGRSEAHEVGVSKDGRLHILSAFTSFILGSGPEASGRKNGK